jgi:hypothetical protein
MTNSKDKQQVYADFNYLADLMEKAPDDEFKYYKNTYMYGGQDAYLSPQENSYGSVLSTACKDPWLVYLTFWEGLYYGLPGSTLSIFFPKERESDTQD